MKYFVFICLLLSSFFSCKRKELNYYHGVVVDENLNPISGVVVKTDYSVSNTTAKDGYFKLSRRSNTYDYLIFFKKGYKIDTTRTVWAESGESLGYSFLNERIDTIQLRKLNKK